MSAATTLSPPRSSAQWLLPSITDVIFLALLFSLSLGLAQKLLGDAGIGWHIRTGQLIWQTHSIPRTDPFSSTMGGQTWYAWEWLYDVVIAAIHGGAGLNGVVFFTAAIIALTFALTFRLTLARGAPMGATLLFLMLSMGAASVHFLTRPHVFSWLFMVIWFELLSSPVAASKRRRRILWMLALMVLWVNVHGGFLAGLALLIIFWIADAVRSYRAHEVSNPQYRKRQLQGLGLLAAIAASTLVNPFGYKLYVHIYQYLSNRFLMSHIEEFLSPNFHGLPQKCFALLFLLTLLVLAVGRRKPTLVELLILIFAVASGLYATRNLPVSSLLLTLVAAPLASPLGDSDSVDPSTSRIPAIVFRVKRLFSRMTKMESGLRGHLWALAGLLIGVGIVANGGKLGTEQIIDARFSAERFPVNAVSVIGQRDIREPIFCPDYWGGYLIYRLYPQTRVVIDDRHDLYGERFLSGYLKVDRAEPQWDQFLNEHQVQWVLVRTGSPTANLLQLTSEWKVEYSDKVAVLLQRAGPQ